MPNVSSQTRKLCLGIIVSLIAAAGTLLVRRSSAQDRATSNYLSAKLRQDVDALKRDAERQPTNESNMLERGLIVWDWINAYSLTGGPVPVNATQELAPIFQLKDGGEGAGRPAALRRLPEVLDELIYEFRIKDERPRGIPTLRLDRDGPFPAASRQTIRMTLTCGEIPMAVGSTMMLGRMLQSDGSTAQVDSPGGDGYVSIRSSNSGVKFAKAKVPWAGMHGGFRGSRLDSLSLRKETKR